MGGDLLRTLAPKENGFISDLRLWGLAQINHERVHGYSTDDSGLASSDQHMAFIPQARETIAISERQHANALMRAGLPTHPITNCITWFEIMDRDDLAL